MRRILNQKFFERNTRRVARELLGMFLVRRIRGKEIASMITEVEAYDGPHDRASHAAKGETPRTKIMFGPAGRWYVYFVYGMHWMLNVVTGDSGFPAAVLIRGTEAASGPGRVTKQLRVSEAFNGVPAHPRSGLWIEDRGIRVPRGAVQKSARIGVSYAGPVWANKEYRFYIRTGQKMTAPD